MGDLDPRQRIGKRELCGAAAALFCAAFAPAVAAGGPTSGEERRTAGLPRAEIIKPLGVDPALLDGTSRDQVRVAIILDDQPVLEKTTEPNFERALSGYTRGDLQQAARRDPEGISDLEADAAHEAERRRTNVVSELQDEVAAIEDAQAPVERAVERAGGDVATNDLAATGALALVTAEVDRADLDDVANREDVQAIVAAPKPRPQLDTSTTTIGAASVWPQHNGGADPDGPAGGAADERMNLEIGMASDPPNPSHPAFAGILINNGAASGGAHGTATTGVVASRDATYRGVAPGVAAIRGGTADDWAAPDPVEARNQSFGYEPTSDDNANVADLSANTFMVPWAASAGNFNDDDGVTPGSPTTGGDAMGRNILSTGAIADISTLNANDDAVAEYSSWGPTPGGRKKPDIVAPGHAITTPSVGGGFDTNDGTSLASPHVAGALAILAGAGMIDPRAMRATLINSAQPWCNGHVPGHDPPPPGPTLVDDPNYGAAPGAGVCQTGWEPDVGWGELDVANAISQRGNSVIGDVEAGKARFYRATVDPQERTTLAWNMRGVLGQFVGDHVYYAVTNLNLSQYRPDGTLIAPPSDPGWGAGPDAGDPNDTVEQVRGPSPGGELVYKVSADSTVEGQAAERFGLASANPLTPLESPDVDPVSVSQSGTGPINCSQTVTVSARLANPSSDIGASPASLTLELPSGLEFVSGSATQSVAGGGLEPDETSEQVSWTVRATGSGTHQLAVRGQGTAYGTTFANREQLDAISADCTPPRLDPTGLSVNPSAEVECGQVQTLATAFRNPTITDASGAHAEISLSGADLVSGAQNQAVSGGTLSAGSTSGTHSWDVLIPSLAPGTTSAATATIIARTDLNSQAFTAQVTLRCSRPAPPPPPSEKGNVRLVADKLVFKKADERLFASGRLDGSTSKRVTGKVEIDFVRLDSRKRLASRDKRKTKRATIEPDGSFKASFKTCRKGDYKAFAEYPGSDNYEPLGRTKIGEKERHPGC